MNTNAYTQDYFEIIGDALDDLRAEESRKIETISDTVAVQKEQFHNMYGYLCMLIDRLKDRTATYQEVEMFLTDLERKMSRYI